MHDSLEPDLSYVIRLEEITWGSLLLAATLVIHGVGLFQTMRVSGALMARAQKLRPAFGMIVLILMAWMIVAVHLLEVMVWAGFFVWTDAQPSASSAFYRALVNYTTLGAGYLPQRWRLLEGMLGMSGLLCFAWSASAMIAVAQELMQRAFVRRQKKHATH